MDRVRKWWIVAMVVLSMGCSESYTKNASDSDDKNSGGEDQKGGAGGVGSKTTGGEQGSSMTDPALIDPGMNVAGELSDGAGGESGQKKTPGELDINDAPPGTMMVEGTPLCGGVECKENEECCLLTGVCFDPKISPQECVAPTEDKDPIVPDKPETCASNADCAPDEYCENHDFCLGPGKCQSRVNCGSSSGDSTVCGCDGLTYPNQQSLCFAGVRMAARGECGVPQTEGAGGGHAGNTVIPCAREDDCPAGQSCCALMGRCYDEAFPVLCTEPPEGTYRTCLENSHCLPEDFCYGDGCEGPGGCMYPGRSECTGVLQPVCGCDGQTYTNAACATAAGIRVDHDGKCE